MHYNGFGVVNPISQSVKAWKSDTEFHSFFISHMTLKLFMCPVIHLHTFQPPVDGAKSLVLLPVKDFYRRLKKIV